MLVIWCFLWAASVDRVRTPCRTSFMLSVFDWHIRWRWISKDVSLDCFHFPKRFYSLLTWKCVTDCQEGFFFFTWVAEPNVCFLQTLNAEPIQIVVTHSLVFSPKLLTLFHPTSYLTTPCSYWEQVLFYFGFFEIIYSNLFLCTFAQCYCIDCYLSVYSPFSSHCWCAFSCVFDACV